jgi:hypothetical protein
VAAIRCPASAVQPLVRRNRRLIDGSHSFTQLLLLTRGPLSASCASCTARRWCSQPRRRRRGQRAQRASLAATGAARAPPATSTGCEHGARRTARESAARGTWRTLEKGRIDVDRARGRGGHLDEMTAQPAPPLHTCTSHVARHASATAWMDRTRTPAHSAARGRTPALGGARTHRGGNAGGVGRAHAAPQHHSLRRRLPLLVQLSVHSPPHTRRPPGPGVLPVIEACARSAATA